MSIIVRQMWQLVCCQSDGAAPQIDCAGRSFLPFTGQVDAGSITVLLGISQQTLMVAALRGSGGLLKTDPQRVSLVVLLS